MRVINYRPIQNDVLRGTFSLIVDKYDGLILDDMKHFTKGGSDWVGMPSRMYMDGSTKKYKDVASFDDAGQSRIFKAAAMLALDTYLQANPRTKVLDIVQATDKDFWVED